MAADPQPQSLPLTSPKVREATPAVASTTPRASGRSTRVTRDVRESTPADDERGDADRHVDQEDPTPAGGDQQPADDRAHCGGHPTDRGPRSHGSVPAFSRVGGEDQAEGGRREQRRSRRLYETEDDEHADAGGGGTGGGGRSEDGDAEEKGAVAAVTVGEAPEEHQQRRVDDGVPVQHPGQLAQVRCLEVPGDLGQGHVDDEQVEAGQHHAGAGDDEHLAGGCVAPVLGGPRGPG